MSGFVRPDDGLALPRAVGRERDAYEPWRRDTATVEDQERAAALGAAVRGLRLSHGFNQRTTAQKAGIGERHLQRLERGERLTRRGTLERLVQALEPDPATTASVLEGLLQVAGPTLAPDSEYADRVERRRARRQAHIERNQHERVSVARVMLITGQVLERRVTDKPDEGSGRRKSITYVVIGDNGGEIEIEPAPDLLKAFTKFPVKWSRPYG